MAIRDVVQMVDEVIIGSIEEGSIGHHVTTTGGESDVHWKWDVTWESDDVTFATRNDQGSTG